jgi:hypothetical protein
VSRRHFESKQFSTWAARAALRGVEMRRTIDDHGDEIVIATRWALTKELQSVDQVEDFLTRMGAAPG